MKRYIALLLVLTVSILGCSPDTIKKLEGKKIHLTGKIHKVGNEPFTQLAIQGPENKNLIIVCESIERKRELNARQGQNATLEGRIKIVENTTADGKHTLYNYLFIVE